MGPLQETLEPVTLIVTPSRRFEMHEGIGPRRLWVHWRLGETFGRSLCPIMEQQGEELHR